MGWCSRPAPDIMRPGESARRPVRQAGSPGLCRSLVRGRPGWPQAGGRIKAASDRTPRRPAALLGKIFVRAGSRQDGRGKTVARPPPLRRGRRRLWLFGTRAGRRPFFARCPPFPVGTLRALPARRPRTFTPGRRRTAKPPPRCNRARRRFLESRDDAAAGQLRSARRRAAARGPARRQAPAPRMYRPSGR